MRSSGKPPHTRRTFTSAFDEMDYLAQKISYWLYQRFDPASARPYCARLEQLLLDFEAKEDVSMNLVHKEYWALVHECRGDIEKAVEARKREIQLTERVFEIDGPIGSVNFSYLARTCMHVARLSGLRGDEATRKRATEQARRISVERGLNWEELAKWDPRSA